MQWLLWADEELPRVCFLVSVLRGIEDYDRQVEVRGEEPGSLASHVAT